MFGPGLVGSADADPMKHTNTHTHTHTHSNDVGFFLGMSRQVKVCLEVLSFGSGLGSKAALLSTGLPGGDSYRRWPGCESDIIRELGCMAGSGSLKN